MFYGNFRDPDGDENSGQKVKARNGVAKKKYNWRGNPYFVI